MISGQQFRFGLWGLKELKHEDQRPLEQHTFTQQLLQAPSFVGGFGRVASLLALAAGTHCCMIAERAGDLGLDLLDGRRGSHVADLHPTADGLVHVRNVDVCQNRMPCRLSMSGQRRHRQLSAPAAGCPQCRTSAPVQT